MAVDYRDVNMQLEPTANQLPYQSSLFQRLGGQQFFAKVYNLWPRLRLAEDSSKVTAIITPWKYISVWHAHSVSQLPRVNIRQGWRMRF